jgi:hypothetical protein
LASFVVSPHFANYVISFSDTLIMQQTYNREHRQLPGHLWPSSAASQLTSSYIGTQSVQPQALFGGAAAANFELPFLLSIDAGAASDPQAATVFTDLLKELAGQSKPPTAEADRVAQHLQSAKLSVGGASGGFGAGEQGPRQGNESVGRGSSSGSDAASHSAQTSRKPGTAAGARSEDAAARRAAVQKRYREKKVGRALLHMFGHGGFAWQTQDSHLSTSKQLPNGICIE